MGKEKEKTDASKDLRKLAEKALQDNPPILQEMPLDDTQVLIHELQTHQIELSMQNEELRNTQDELQESRDKYYELFDFAPVGYFTLDKTGLILEANLVGAEQLGVERKSLIKRGFNRYISPEFQDKFYIRRKRAQKAGAKQSCELKLVKKDGTSFFAQLEIVAFKDLEQYWVTIIDRTEHKLAEERFQESRTIQALIDAITESVLLIDKEGVVFALNEVAAKRMGLSKDKIVQRNIFESLPHDVAAFRRVKCEEVSRTGKPVRFADERSNIYLLHTLYPMFAPDGSVEKIVIYAQDLTSKMKTENALEQRTIELHMRIKELNCLYKVSQLLGKQSSTLAEILQGVVEIIPTAFQDPDAICAHIRMNGQEFKSEKSKKCQWKESFDIELSGKPIGSIGIGYKEGLFPADSALFPAESTTLLKTVAEQIAKTFARIQADEDLRESEEKYRLVVDNASEAILVVQDGVFKYVNSALSEILKYPKEDLLSKAVFDFVHPDDKITVMENYQNRLSGNEGPDPYDLRIIDAKGATKWLRNDVVVITWEGSAAALNFATDVTAQKEAEEKLRLNEEKFRKIFEESPIGIMIFDQHGKPLDLNNAFREIFGIRGRKDIKGLNLFESPDLTNDAKAALGRGETVSFEGVYDFKKTEDSYFTRTQKSGTIQIHAIISPLHASLRVTGGHLLLIQDISERKHAEEQIHFLTQKLMETQENDYQAISRELHDRIAQDLSFLKIECDLLMKYQPELAIEADKKLAGMSTRLKEVIQSVRDLSYDLRPPAIDELGIVRTIFHYAEDFCKQSGMNLDFSSVGVDSLKFDSNSEINLYRVVQEALNNIKKHSEASTVTMKLVAAFPNIIIRITDDGKGFDAATQKAQITNTKRMGMNSMGERVKLLNGNIEIQSRPMQGTKIIIKLPYPGYEHGTKKDYSNRR